MVKVQRKSSADSLAMPRKHRPVGAGLGEQLARRTHNCKGRVALVFLTMTTKPTFRAEFKPGKRRQNRRLHGPLDQHTPEKGPWSEIATATVAA